MNIHAIIDSAYTKTVLIVVFILATLSICFHIKKNSYYDLDIVLYTACDLDNGKIPHSELHHKTYKLAKHDLGQKYFDRLTDSTKYYRHSIYSSPENFYSQLPFYKVKPLYVFLLSTANALNISPYQASTYINILSYVAIATILLIFLWYHIGFYRSYFASLSVLLLPILTDTAKNNTPDLLAVLFGLIAIILFLSSSSRNHYLAIVSLLLLQLLRPETIILVYCFVACTLLFKSEFFSKKTMLSLLGIGTFSYLLVSIYSSGYSWPVLYKHSFIAQIPDLQTQLPHLSLGDYFAGFKKLFSSIFYSDFALIIFFLSFTIFKLKGEGKNNKLFIVAIVVIASIIFRILLFPDLPSRYYAGTLIISFILFLLSMNQNKIQNTLV